MSDLLYHVCPDCKNHFVQPFVCITCGAEKLYDTTVRQQASTIVRQAAEIERRGAEIERLTGALLAIMNHPHNPYPDGYPAREERTYEVGAADAHMCAANIARAALERKP